MTVTRARWVESPQALMEDITASSGIDVDEFHDNWTQSGPPYRAVNGDARLLDYQRDGLSDLLWTDNGRVFLYKGLGLGRFENVTEAAGLSRVTALASMVIDLDNDGYEDIVFAAPPGFEISGRKVGSHVFKNRRNLVYY